MDCCNYMPYRHPQPYYGSQYFHDNFPAYHGDFYGQQMYHDYYGTNPYYSPQHWQGFMPPDYVYNPKEARLRKAIREASRDRAIGASPMLPRPNARRATPHAWMPGQHDDQIMMPTIRCPPVPTGLDPSPCYPGTGNEPFMAMAPSGYCTAAKMESPLPPPPPPQASVAQNAGGVHHPSSYIQPNPLAQLQQQTEMWPGFQDDLRPRSSGNPYMLQEVPPTHHYHHQPSPPLSIPSPMMLDKHRHTPLSLHSLTNPSTPITPPHSNSNLSLTPPHSNENVPPEELRNQTVKVSEDSCGFESKQQIMEQVTQPLMETNNVQHHQQNDGYMSVLSPELQAAHHQQQLDKAQEDAKIKKISGCNIQFCPNNHSLKNTLYLPLSCSNFCASPDLYANNLDYQREYISKYFLNYPDYEVLNFMSEDGDTFPYATLSNCVDDNFILQETPYPSFIRTDVGYIPITADNINKNNPHVTKMKSTNFAYKK